MRNVHIALCLVLLGAVGVACGAVRQAGQYSDDAVRAAKGLLRTESDELAIKCLDDAAAAAAREASAVEGAAVTWSQRVDSMEARVVDELLTPPDDVGRIRAWVVGSTCDAMDAASKGELSALGLQTIIMTNQRKSGLPDAVGMPEAIGKLAEGIQTAVDTGDTSSLGRFLICNALGG